jgi:hypothetical protein
MCFALAMGVVGGLLPAWRAARMSIIDRQRAAQTPQVLPGAKTGARSRGALAPR